ncbi:PDZ domain-containing protein [Trinickia caryophylli]|uniref:Predicted metalloprotease, contains C-terminal PDZ domain n=1 Tax=Trinickia caryophylli TaxID=28094 RepID=A0A1X7F169_TRICW|nr:PDZ domain-containing protein [Trinickia caryophylli]PMS10341.1 PDZ domain-containing protein [Trinickia caryophylli]TRX19538.1 M61 family metallopeptidase [Trinickia caryophylli]WQE13152.1 PDZ domain-containing protein [Trinickia caryophylli]SMF44001.1 Predicted metalloprotease, contains C-terminal PDZ domain [Trinickia caryophylli]GLU34548.1 peptidase [Trinickia caryophylli]
MNPIRYAIVPKHPAAHLFEVTLTVVDPDPEGQRFMLPTWIPGSYMVREFARNIVTLVAFNEAGRRVRIEKIDKQTWRAAPLKRGGPLTLRYEVYAWDLSVRAAHLDDTTGFFNGTSVFLAVAGREEAPCIVDIRKPAGPAYRGWRVATALAEARGTKRYGFGEYEASNYDELVDHPVTLGEFALATFKAHGVPHDLVIAGRTVRIDLDRLVADLRRICEAQIALFEPRTKKAPVDRYVFMTLAVSDGYGGLEHRASTALICNRTDLPVLGRDETTEGYRTFLGLCSHEYFHTWNVKRIKPAAFVPYDLSRENYTSLLWLFEGFTSYYDDLMLVRSGAIGQSDYFGLLGKTVGSVLRGSGRLKQSVAESSFDSWIKYYRQDENAPNAIVSYYQKGSLVALAFDLAIRAQTNHRKSLDDVMRLLWQRYGRDFYRRGGAARGVGEDEVKALIAEATGVDLGALFDDAVHGTRDLPLETLLAPLGVTLAPDPANGGAGRPGKPSLGVRVRGGADCTLSAVHDGSAAQKAGLSAGDILVAIGGLRVTGSNLEAVLGRYLPGETVDVHAFRRDELRVARLKLDGPEVTRYKLAVADKAGRTVRQARERWLQG